MVCWPAVEKPRNSIDQEEWRETQTQKTNKKNAYNTDYRWVRTSVKTITYPAPMVLYLNK